MSWEEAWQAGRTGWDAGKSAPILHDLIERGVLPPGRALVPGCGAGYDVVTLAKGGWNATGLDLAPTAVERFRQVREGAGVDAESASVEVANFFEWRPETTFDVIWDYTFLCAIEPEMRSEWSQQMERLLSPGGQLVTLIFPVDPDRGDEGPPYRMSPDLVTELLTPRFRNLELEEVTESHPGREGMEWIARWEIA